MAQDNTDYKVRVVFEAMLGKLESGTKQAVAGLKGIGTAGKKAGAEGSRGMDGIARSADEAALHLKKTEASAMKLGSTLKKALTGAAVAYAGKQIISFGKSAVAEFGKTKTALGEVASLGYEDLEGLRKAAVDFSNTWSGTTREEFISAAYDIKSGIASLSDEGVAKFTELAGMTAKATKAATSNMTSLFATGYGIYRKFYENDEAFGQAFAAGIAKSVQQFKTDGAKMAESISTLGASASSANVPLHEQLSILGTLQATMSGSEAGTRYRAFLQSAARAGKALSLSFLDANNQLKSMPDILDQLRSKYGETIDAAEKMELTKAFGTEEAVALIDLLYPKTADLRASMEAVDQSIQGGMQSVKTMADMMNSGPLEKARLVRQAWANLKDKMGEQIAIGAAPAMDDLQKTLVDMQGSADFERLGESIGKLVAAGSELFQKVLDRAPGAVDALADAAKWLADNLDMVTFALKTLLTAWIGFKAASLGGKLFNTVGKGAVGLVKNLKNAGGAVKALKAALTTGLKTNIIGMVITLLISLVGWFFRVTKGVDSWKNKFTVALNEIRMAFYRFVKAIMGWWSGFVRMFNKSWGSAVDRKIKDLDSKIAALNNSNDALRGKPNTITDQVASVADAAKNLLQSSITQPANNGSGGGYTPAPSVGGGGSGGGGSGGSAGGGSAPTVDDRIDAIDKKYAVQVENRELQADLAEGDSRYSASQEFKRQAVDILKRQVNDLLSLEGTQSGNSRIAVENARLNILKKIQELTADIRDGVGKLTGEFNTPSGIDAMTKYQYLVSQAQTGGNSYGRSITNGNVEFHINFKNPGDLSKEQFAEYLQGLAATGIDVFTNHDFDTAQEMARQAIRV